jgi:phosphate:Na+ symporter
VSILLNQALIFGFLGGLGLFLLGMKTMSEGLQKIAGDRLRKILAALTTNRFVGTLVGIGVTTLVQSSSVTTVMVVGFVNAGLMSLTQSIGVILGANVGTTVTAQLIAFKISKYFSNSSAATGSGPISAKSLSASECSSSVWR